tara:strand:- start:610 stop:1317 length:708 start_codon:yes stop_codon:yes gene_type:complete
MYGEVNSELEENQKYFDFLKKKGFRDVDVIVAKGKRKGLSGDSLEKFVDKELSNKSNPFVPDIKKRYMAGDYKQEAYEIGADYANHTKEITPGETPDEKPVDSKERTPENPQHKEAKKDKYSMKSFKEYTNDDIYAHLEEELEITEAEYQGKKVKLNDPIRGGNKKFYVYVKNDKGNVIKVSFGDTTGLSIKRDDPERRKSFRARHNCDTAKDKTTARYWSCRMWTARTKVSDLD